MENTDPKYISEANSEELWMLDLFVVSDIRKFSKTINCALKWWLPAATPRPQMFSSTALIIGFLLQ